MKTLILFLLTFNMFVVAKVIEFNEEAWTIEAKAFVLEKYKGKNAIYIQKGLAQLKNTEFLNGTIEFDVFLTERQGFPGVRFRIFDEDNMESFFLSGKLSSFTGKIIEASL